MNDHQSHPHSLSDEPTRLSADSRNDSFAENLRRETQTLTRQLRPGEIWAEKYQILRVLGQGGMGDVYEAAHVLAPDLRFAVKLLRASATEELSRHVLREAGSIARVRHRHVVSVTDVGITPDGVPYLIMEFAGVDLQEYAALRGGVLPARNAVEFCAQICDALAAAHEQGIVHRDIKPRNCFVHRELDIEYVVVGDFGLARSLDRDDSTSRDWTLAGSRGYMAPEVLLGHRRPDHRVDIYSVGATLLCLLTGSPPSPIGLEKAGQSREALEERVPRVLIPILLRTLAFDADRRYRSARELGADLRKSIPALDRAPSSARKTWLPIVLLWGGILGTLALLFSRTRPAEESALRLSTAGTGDSAHLQEQAETRSVATVLPQIQDQGVIAEFTSAASSTSESQPQSKSGSAPKQRSRRVAAPSSNLLADLVTAQEAQYAAQPSGRIQKKPAGKSACIHLRERVRPPGRTGTTISIMLVNQGNRLRIPDLGPLKDDQTLLDRVTTTLTHICRDKVLSLLECNAIGQWPCDL